MKNKMVTYWFISVSFVLTLAADNEYLIENEQFEDRFDRFVSLFRTFDTLYSDNFGTILFENATKTLILECKSDQVITDVIPRFETMISVNNLLIHQCILPVTPLVQAFQTLNINATSIDMLQLCIPSVEPLPLGNYTEGLTIRSLWIDVRYSPINDVLKENPDFLEPLHNLTTLIVWSNRMPTLPDNMFLEILSLRHNAWTLNWKNCEKLRELRLHNLYGEEIPQNWPANCSKLTTVRLKGLTTVGGEQVVANSTGIAAGCKNLHSFYMQSCNQTQVPIDILRVATNLVLLNLSRNRIIDQAFVDFPIMWNLTDLDLSINHLTGWFLTELVKKLPALRNLNLSANKFTILFCDYELVTKSLTTHLTSLERLSLNNMPLPIRCLIEHRFAKLKYLGLSSTQRSDRLWLRDLPRTGSKHLEVDLRENFIDVIGPFGKDAYEDVLRGDPFGFWNRRFDKLGYENTNLTLLMGNLNCDCENYWLARALRETKQNFLTIPGAQCEQSKLDFFNAPLEMMNCVLDQRDNCNIRTIGTFGTEQYNQHLAIAECRVVKDELKLTIPHQTTIIGLNVSNKLISTLHKIKHFPDSLQWVDFRNNSISRLDADEIARLFVHKERRVWLSGNTFFCDCDNTVLLDGLRQYRNQIVDYDDLMCVNSNQPLDTVTSYDVCEIGIRVMFGSVSVLGLLLLAAGLVIWRYRVHLKIYLYSRGLCLFCLREDDIDADRPYDAFLSYTHEDESYVEHLLTKLEGEPDFYRICVHYRDWVVGDWIPKQIMRSVQISKRTIIVLSRNFLGSMWGNLEFRYAVASSVQDGRSRLLVLILDDVLSENLDEELKGYLSYNTYLRCDDPWFWEKLRYAMPRRKKTSNINQGDRTTPINTPEPINIESLQLNNLH